MIRPLFYPMRYAPHGVIVARRVARSIDLLHLRAAAGFLILGARLAISRDGLTQVGAGLVARKSLAHGQGFRAGRDCCHCVKSEGFTS